LPAEPSFRASNTAKQTLTLLAERLGFAGFLLFAAFAPHSIAGAELSLAIVGAGWLTRTLLTGRTGFRRTPFDLPILLFFFWTILSAFLSEEPRISLPKLQSVCVLLLFYLTQGVLTRRTAIMVAVVMIASGAVGSVWSAVDLMLGRGVLIARMSDDSPLRSLPLVEGDAVWRVAGHRISSVEEIDEAIRKQPAGTQLSVSAFSQGENAEFPGFTVTDAMKTQASPSGITGGGRAHRFRASGWTRHYEYFAEILQMLAQCALGLALCNLQKGASRWRARFALAAFVLLSSGIALTAMRTVLVALAIGASVVAFRANLKRAKLIIVAAIILIMSSGALVVWRTRNAGALRLQDPSSSLRWQVARAGLSRIRLHPFFGHGMDAVKQHWTEWGFPGTLMIHLHSTPLQLAFDRGLPALALWLWIIWMFWSVATKAEREARNSVDANRAGLLLGATGALAGFFASSLVNYNFGAGIVALVFWWLAGTVVVLSNSDRTIVTK